MYRTASKFALIFTATVSVTGCTNPGDAGSAWPAAMFNEVVSTVGWATIAWLLGQAAV